MDIDAPYCGWTNWATWKTAQVFENVKKYTRHLDMVIDDCAEDGMSKDRAVARVADELKDLVYSEFYDVQNDASDLVLELMLGPKDLGIDYEQIAQSFMSGYRPRQSSDNRRPTASQCRRGTSKAASKTKTSNNRGKSNARPAPRRR